ncbi:MAG: outer membrane beta-barrel protein [Cyclobacteriaceae bacterium]
MLNIRPLILATILFISFSAIGQTAVSGRILDSNDGSAIPSALVRFINIKDSVKSKYTVTDFEGNFSIQTLDQAFYRLNISSLGYEPSSRILRVIGDQMDLGTLSLIEDVTVLSQVEVQGEVVAIEVKGDTVQYNADAYKVNPDASASDLVSKMPGIVVDTDGVTANGESVEQVLLDGKRFFGQDPLLSLNNIPAEMVDNIQIYDEQSDQAQFTGFDDGNTTKTMNVVTKENKRNGQFGRLYAGAGTDETYKAGGVLNSFNKDQRITLLGMSNNINQQNFSNQDLAGIGGSGGRRGGRRSGSNQNVLTGNQDGITQTNSFGLNFTDKWGSNTNFEGSYFFNQTENSNNTLTNRESFLTDQTLYYDEDSRSSTDNVNHRLNLRLDHKINDNNNLLVRSSIGYQDNLREETTIGTTTNEAEELINSTNNVYSSHNEALSLSNNLTFQHKFEKIGRTVSLNLSNALNLTDRNNSYQDQEVDSTLLYLTDEINNSWSTKLTYTEPVGNNGLLSGAYKLTTNKRNSDKDTYLEDAQGEQNELLPALSSHFNSGYTTHLPSVSFSNRSYGGFINTEVFYQHATLSNEQFFPEEIGLSTHFNSLLVSAMGRFDLSEKTNLFVRYRTSTNEPSVSQLQTVIDNSNPLFLSVGNPSLDQSYSHDFMIRLNKNNIDKNVTLANFTNIKYTEKYITNATNILSADSTLQEDIVAQRGAQISQPINLNGYWSIRNNTTFSTLISPIKSNINTTLGLTYTRLPGQTNDIRNISNTYSGNIRLGLVSNISEKIDYNLYYNLRANKVYNSIQSDSQSSYYTQTFGGKLNLIFGKGFVFRSDIYHLNYNGVSSSSDINYTLWNMSVAKKFLKNDQAELELTVFDLLKQNQSIDQQVTSSYLQETQTEVLQRYFMLTFTYQIRSFRS